MALLKNKAMAGKDLITSFGKITFDENGVSDVDKEVAIKLSSLKGYSTDFEAKAEDSTVEEVKVESKVENEPEEVEEVKAEEETPVEEKVDFEKMNVPQLKKYAKDNEIDLGDAAKKVDIIAILEK